MIKEQTIEQIKTDAINEFVCHIKDKFNIDLSHVAEHWRDETEKL